MKQLVKSGKHNVFGTTRFSKGGKMRKASIVVSVFTIFIAIFFVSSGFAADIIKPKYPVQGGLKPPPTSPKLFEVSMPIGHNQGMFHPKDLYLLNWVPPTGYDRVNVELWKGPMFVKTFEEKIPNYGNVKGSVPSEGVAEGDGYYFKVIAISQDKVYGDSPTFSIRKPFVILDPKPDAIMCVNKGKLTFNWETRGTVNSVIVSLQGSGASGPGAIVNKGIYEWNIGTGVSANASSLITFLLCEQRQDNGTAAYCESVPFRYKYCQGK